MPSTCGFQLLSDPDMGFDVELTINDYNTRSTLTANGSVTAIVQAIKDMVDQERSNDRTVALNVLFGYGPNVVSRYGLDLTEVSVGTRMDRAPGSNIPLQTFRK